MLSAILSGLIAQNLALGHRQIALEALCSTLISELCLLAPDPDYKMLRLSAELNGAATAVADRAATLMMSEPYDTAEITQMIEGVTRVAEQTLSSKTRKCHRS